MPGEVSQQSKLQSQAEVADFAICVRTNQIQNDTNTKRDNFLPTEKLS